ncbi:MAG: hypothetical protein QOF30_1070 [Acidimicrobiaceae bacterium]|nr:hypothetical protein [Acidimicrobiaceae bacterium]
MTVPDLAWPAESADPNVSPAGKLWLTCSPVIGVDPRFLTVMAYGSGSPAATDVRPSSMAMFSGGEGAATTVVSTEAWGCHPYRRGRHRTPRTPVRA